MPDQNTGDKQHEATPEKLRRAREEGQIPQSKEIPSALMLFALLVILALTASTMCRFFVDLVKTGLTAPGAVAGGQATATDLLTDRGWESLWKLVPFLLIAGATSIFSSLIVAGWAYSPKAVGFKFDRINPVNGLKNMFSLKSVMTMVIGVAKLTLVLLIVWGYLHDKMEACLALHWAQPAGALTEMARLVFGLLLRIAAGLLAIAAIDLFYQRFSHKKKMRMSTQEVKDERRQHELAPELKGRIREVQSQIASKRMLTDVPEADVVIANPTHVAVALKYESGAMQAPVVVAKGPDLLCQKIKDVARAHGVPVVERPQLARSLYAAAEVGDAIPAHLFVAVAEVLAMIYRTRQKRQSQR